MKKTVVVVLSGLAVLVLAYVALRVAGFVAELPDAPERPGHLDVVEVQADGIGLERRELARGPFGSVTDLRPDGFGDDACPFLVGERAAAWLETATCPARSVPFPDRTFHVDTVDWDGDAEPEFLSRGQWCCAPMLLDARGNVLWRLSDAYENAANDTAVARDPKGPSELVVAFNGSTGVIRMAADGTERWRHEDGNVWHIAAVDVDADGRTETVHSNAGGQLTVLSATGEPLAAAAPEAYFSDFDVVDWRGDARILHVAQGSLHLLEPTGAAIAEFIHPAAFALAEPRGAVVENPDGEAWLVSLLSSRNFDRSVLAVHDLDGHLHYSEILEGGCEAIAAAGPSRFWIGCPDVAFEYTRTTP